MKPLLLIGILTCAACGQTTPEAAPAAPRPSQPAVTNLNGIRRVYVDALAGDSTAEALRQLIIASLQQSRLFVLTDNPDRADATLRGAANDTAFTDTFDSQEGENSRSNGGAYSGRSTSSGKGAYGGLSVGENETHHIRERKHEAYATVRLCNRDGDVLWATTQESKGAKFRSASADVAEKITHQLQFDFAKTLRNQSAISGVSAATEKPKAAH